MSLLLFLLSLASCASKAPGAGEVDTLTSQSKFVFRGTVQKNNDATMPETVTTARTVVVKVQEVLRSPEVIGDFSGREIVVQLREGAPAKPGQQLVFFANGWVYGRSLAVIEVGRTRVPDNAAGLGQLVAVAVQKEEDKKVQARIDLAAAYRLVALYGWDDLIFTHISARVPGGEHHFLLNPYGMMFEEVTASSLVKVDLAGNKVDESPYFVNPAGFTIHSAVHAAREDALCVMHLHTDYGIAVSAQKDGLLPISQQAMLALASLAYHDYEGLALNEEEKPRLVADLGDKSHMILRNHGLLTVGRTAAEAFLAMFLLERACKIQILAQAGGELVSIPDPVLRLVESQVKAVTVGQGAALTWPGLLRKLDRIDRSYRD